MAEPRRTRTSATEHLPAAAPAPGALPAEPCEHCGQMIVRTTALADGAPLPIDATPSALGDLLLEHRPHGIVAGVAIPRIARGARASGRPTYLAHSRSCPLASVWHKPAARPARRRPGGRRG